MKTDGSDQNNKSTPKDEERKTLQKQVEAMASQFQHALPNKIGVERMMRIVMTAILNNPKLAQCEPNSFFGAVLQALQLGLEVNTPLGQAYLIPRWDKNAWGKDKGGYKCNFQMGYRGLIELCYRYGKYRRIQAEIVYEGDTFDYEYGTNQHLQHIPQGKSEKPICVWALYEMDNGGGNFVVWTWEKIIKHAETFSESYDDEKQKWNFSAWSSNEESRDSMAKKTMVDRVLKYAPKSAELIQASYVDEKPLIARHVVEGDEAKFQIDVDPKFIEDGHNNAETVPVQKAENGEKTTAPVPAGNGNGKPQSAGQTAAPAGNGKPPETGKANPPAAKNNNSLYPQDENDRLEEQYRQQTEQPDLGPDWSKK
jgi:recombination protein RecT